MTPEEEVSVEEEARSLDGQEEIKIDWIK